MRSQENNGERRAFFLGYRSITDGVSGRGRGSLYKGLFAYFSLFSTSAFDEVGSGSTRKTL